MSKNVTQFYFIEYYKQVTKRKQVRSGRLLGKNLLNGRKHIRWLSELVMPIPATNRACARAYLLHVERHINV